MSKITVGDYLLMRLKELGIQHIFGVAGDYNLGFLDQVVNQSDLTWVGACNELNAAYAADGYARVKGISALVTTFGVGELSAMNGIAGAYAEQVPIVHIIGHPATRYADKKMLMHHTLGDGNYNIFADLFKPLSAYNVILQKESTAAAIDKALLACWRKKRPVYIGLPTDISFFEIDTPAEPLKLQAPTLPHTNTLATFVENAAQLLETAKAPLVLIDFYAHRHQIQQQILTLLEKTGLPFATLPMAKGILNESHNQFMGISAGLMSDPEIQKYIQSADCIITFGTLLCDANSGGFSINLDPQKVIEITADQATLQGKLYSDIQYISILPLLTERLKAYRYQNSLHKTSTQTVTAENSNIIQKRFWPLIAHFLEKDSIVIAETGTSMFGAINMPMPDGTTFIAQLLWGSIGYAVGGLLGAAIAAPHRPAVLFVGDGAFQLTAQEISTILRHQLTPTIFLLDNDGYTIERFIRGANMPYNDIQHWHYKDLPFVFGDNVWSTEVITETDLISALAERKKHPKKLGFIVVKMNKMDTPEELNRLMSQQQFDPYKALN